jgi:hypothetical protein
MTGETVMPLPPDVRAAVGQLVADYRTVAKAISHTQVAENPPNGVPGWVGESADAYMGSIQKLGEHARGVPPVFASAVGVLEQWSDQVGVMITATVPELWEQYDQADREYRNALAEINHRMLENHSLGGSIPETEFATQRQQAAEVLRSTQDEVLAQYRKAMDQLDDEAQNAANALKGLQDSLVDPTKQDSRAAVGSTLFNDIPVLDGQAEWEYAQEQAKEAAEHFTHPPSSLEELLEFQQRYGDQCSNPFFAQALAQHVTPEQITRLLAFAQHGKNQGQDESLDKLCQSLGSMVVLSTGGMNADPTMAQLQEDFSLVRDGLKTNTGDGINQLIDTQLERWKSAGNTLFTGEGAALGPDSLVMDARAGNHYGHEYLATLLSSAANANPNLALGPEFFAGNDSLAHNIVAFDHAHGEEIARSGGYGSWGPYSPPGGNRHATDPVESMLRLMDEPQALSDGTIPANSPEWSSSTANNSKRFEAVQDFLTSDTNFVVNPDDESPRIPPFTETGPMNMARYLTGFRDNELYAGTQDGGDSLGRVLAQSSATAPPPQELDHDSPEYQSWRERNKKSTEIAGNFLLGYQEGLEIQNDLILGEDPFGKNHAALRGWSGTILAPHVSGITDSLQVPGQPGLSVGTPQGDEGYQIRLGTDLKNRIIGTNGLFSDLAFDKPSDTNGTPDDIAGNRTVSGREPALSTLLVASNAGYKHDMDLALANGDIDAMEDAQDRWAPILNDLTVAPDGASEQVKQAIKESNNHWKSLVQHGVGMVPFNHLIGDGHNVAKWLIDQSKGIALPKTLDTLLSNYDAAGLKVLNTGGHEGMEMSMQSSIYQAISEGNYWGDDPTRTPQEYLAKHKDGTSFLDEEGNVIPYDQMNEKQAREFQEYVTSKDGLRRVFRPVLTHGNYALDHAELERQEALGEKEPR